MSVLITQVEIDYLCTCTRYLDCYTVDRDELVRKLTSLSVGCKRLELAYPEEE